MGAGRRPGGPQSRRPGDAEAVGAVPARPLRDVPLRDVPLRDVALRDVPLRDVALGDVARRDVALAAEPRPTTSLLGESARLLFQPGNSSWEAMWRAKAGFVPSSRPEARAGDQDGEPASNA